MTKHNQSFRPDDIADQLAYYIWSGARSKEELISFCIQLGMKPTLAHDLVHRVIKRMESYDSEAFV
jgi:hypothetical protein